MLDISLLQIRYAIEIEKTGSISQAAKNLYMNQPNLSKSIKELENHLGITIFMRTPKGVIPTKDGKMFLQYAYEIISRLDQLEKKIKDRKENQVSFHISIPRATYITHAFTEFVKDIQDIRNIKINYSETNTMDAVENILNHGFDLGIIRYPQEFQKEFQNALKKSNLLSREIWDFEYLLLMSKKHPLAKKSEIFLEDLEEYTELVHGDVYVPFISQREIDKTNPSGAKNKRIYLYERGSQFDLLRNVTTTYMWVSPLPEEVLSHHELVQIKCPESTTRFKDVLIYLADHRFSSYDYQFISTLMKTKEEIQAYL